jgi:phosphorylase/glycogen(starch) synthase
VFAGKAHPNDSAAFDLIKQIVRLSKEEEFLGKIVFLEGYNMNVARRMLSGVDIWLNNPRRPLEASGTSGQKAGMNGAINFSVLDGWWDEAYDGKNGFCIGSRKEYKNPATQDLTDSDSLYDTLENEIIPLFYTRNSRGIPEKWIKMMKKAIISTISEYNTHRMIKDYTEQLYVPTANRFSKLYDGDYKKFRQIAEWKNSIRARFPGIHIVDISIEGISGDILNVGDKIEFSLEVNKGKINKEEIISQIIVFQDKTKDDYTFSGEEKRYDEDITIVPMECIDENDSALKFKAGFTASKSGKFNYGIRILPYHEDVDDIVDLNLVYWG